MLVRSATDHAQVIACACRSTAALCDRCVDDSTAQLRGTAQCRGEEWAAAADARSTPAQQARQWRDDEKVRAIAATKVADLTKDAGLLDRLVDEVQLGASRRWRKGVHRPYFVR